MGRIKFIIQSPANVRPWPKRLTSSVPNIFIRRRVLLPLDGPHWRRLRPVRPLLLVVHPVVVVIVVATTRLPEHVVLLVKPEAVAHVGFKFVLTWKKVLGWKNYRHLWKATDLYNQTKLETRKHRSASAKHSKFLNCRQRTYLKQPNCFKMLRINVVVNNS